MMMYILQEHVRVVGRIMCDSQGKLNPQSVLLEGSRESSAGRCIPVSLTDVPQYSLFPGQVCQFKIIKYFTAIYLEKQDCWLNTIMW